MKPDLPRIRCKRVYQVPEAEECLRVLVDPLWPRGLSRESARLDLWCREIAPSDGLRRCFGHRPERWEAFRHRYLVELESRPEAVEALLGRIREAGEATLLYAAKDPDHNNAVVLLEHLRRRLREEVDDPRSGWHRSVPIPATADPAQESRETPSESRVTPRAPMSSPSRRSSRR